MKIVLVARGVLIRGPYYAEIRHIQENGTPWPEVVGQFAEPLGGGRYAVGPIVVEVEPFRAVHDGKAYGCSEHWRPLLELARKAVRRVA